MHTKSVTLVVPYPGAETQVVSWSDEDASIDFRRQPDRAARCTLAFAAVELKHYLARTLPDTVIAFAAHRPAAGFWIELHVENPSSKDGRFTIVPEQDGVVLRGRGRAGALYAAYELLRDQGWRWYAPGAEGEIAPPPREQPALPKQARAYAPSMDLARGFDLEGLSKESSTLLVWMARNRLNLCGSTSNTHPLAEKLGMISKMGGHIFESLLDPDRVLASGRTIWEEHRDWYGTPALGEPTKSTALNVQFCVSRPDLIDYLSEEVIRRIGAEYKVADRLDIWTFDTWGAVCQCDACRTIGNASDRTLHFLSQLRERIDLAIREGRLDHNVQLVTNGYEGTCTIEGPKNPIPQNLIDAGDHVGYAPILRCYAHDFCDPQCDWNRGYVENLKSWLSPRPALGVMVEEYFNVSKFEDLPLLFVRRMARDLPAYHAMGVRGMTYMHLPMVNWAMRTLTQALYAQLAWEVGTDVAAFLDEYFQVWYGPYAVTMRRVYEHIEDAWPFSAQWRAWGDRSILTQLIKWDGRRPKAPLIVGEHFADARALVESGRQSATLLYEALAEVEHAQGEESDAFVPDADLTAAVNPVQARERNLKNRYEKRLGEDRRLLRYGCDTMTLMTETAAYHDALYRNDPAAADAAWARVAQTAGRMDGYYVPLTFDWPGPGFEARDALTRTQLRPVIRRCRYYRKNGV